MSLSIVYVIVAQFITGFGLATRLRVVNTAGSLLGLSMLIGLGVSSALPLLLQWAHTPLTRTPLCIGLCLVALLSMCLLFGQKAYVRSLFRWQRLSLRIGELPFFAFWGYLLFISAWKCAWFPVQPFDSLVGPDLVATFAVRERTLVSSVFTTHLPSASVFSNQPFYAPFTAMQQIIYLLASQGVGPFAFGKLWLTVLVIAFGLFFYSEVRERIHPLLAGLLVTVVACSPELFAYTFLLQTDWANAAFLVTGVILLQRYLETGRCGTERRRTGRRGALIGSALLLALACWTRTETIFFVLIGSLLLVVKGVQQNPKQAFFHASYLFMVCLLPVLFWNYGFLRGYVPLPPNTHLGQFQAVPNDYFAKLLSIFTAMNKQVVFNTDYWNYSVFIFFGITLFNGLLFRDNRGAVILVWLAGIYLIFGLIIQHIDGANVIFTFRRGFFKLLFLMYYYLSETSLFQWLSRRLSRWERAPVPMA